MTPSPHPHPRKHIALLIAGLLAGAMSPAAMAASASPGGSDAVLSLSLEELMQITVTSVSKKAQSLAETPAAVFVIQAEDIRRSGATNLPEALRLAPGVQVAAIGHNRWAVGIRGFASRFSNKLLVLVDGRAIYSPAFSGVFWEHNDIPLDNVARIEVIRGPGGSIWGANAVNGIINIITHSAADTQGGQVSLAAGDELRGLGMARYGWALDDETQVRLHAQLKDVDPGRAAAGGAGPDDWRSRQAGFRLDGTRGADSFTLHGRFSDYRAGDSITAFQPAFPYYAQVDTDGDGKTAHLLGRWERETDTASHALQVYLDHADNDFGVARYRNSTLDLEYQQRIAGEKHDVVWGLGYRVSKDRFNWTPYITSAASGDTFSLFSAFIQDDITLEPERWRLTLGTRVEHNEFTGFEVQPNIRLLWTPSERDSAWAALSRAVRTPSRGELTSTVFVAPPSPPMVPLPLATVGNGNFASEKLAALDLGWRRQWAENLSSEVAAFYYRYDDLRGATPGSVPLGTWPDLYLPLYIQNSSGAESHGLELALDWLPRPDWRLRASASTFKIRARYLAPGDTTPEFLDVTPSHQVSLRSSLDITPALQWDVWLRHTAKVDGAYGFDGVPAHTGLDMRLAWTPTHDLTLSLVGQNLLDAAHPEHVSGNILSRPVQVERGVYLKAEWTF